MNYCSKAAGIAVFIGSIVTGSFVSASTGNVSTVDSQELFRSRMVSDNQEKSKMPDAGQAVDEAVANLPNLNSRLRWAAVKTPVELAEEEKAAQRKTKAIPIIITAADIDKENKAQKKRSKTEAPKLISPRPLQPPQITPAPVPKPFSIKPAQPTSQQALQGNEKVAELPPIQPVGIVSQPTAAPQEIAELPPITPVLSVPVPVETIMDAIVEATSIELVIDDIHDISVELPAIKPVN